MSEDRTGNMDGRSFEERVFARFDALDARLESVETHLEKLEAKSYDTKPIWERALAELLELREKVDNVEHKVVELQAQIWLQRRADKVSTER
jgi:hypothetical protein